MAKKTKTLDAPYSDDKAALTANISSVFIDYRAKEWEVVLTLDDEDGTVVDTIGRVEGFVEYLDGSDEPKFTSSGDKNKFTNALDDMEELAFQFADDNSYSNNPTGTVGDV